MSLRFYHSWSRSLSWKSFLQLIFHQNYNTCSIIQEEVKVVENSMASLYYTPLGGCVRKLWQRWVTNTCYVHLCHLKEMIEMWSCFSLYWGYKLGNAPDIQWVSWTFTNGIMSLAYAKKKKNLTYIWVVCVCIPFLYNTSQREMYVTIYHTVTYVVALWVSYIVCQENFSKCVMYIINKIWK